MQSALRYRKTTGLACPYGHSKPTASRRSSLARSVRAVALAVLSGLLAAGLPSARAANGVAAANISVVQHDTANTTNSVTVTATLSLNDFRVREGSNRGDYNVQIGSSSSDDVDTGVLLTSVAENGRDNLETAYPGTNFCTSAMEYTRSGANAGAYFIPVFNAPTGAEYNINVSAAFFPYAKWLGGYARNSGDTNGGANDLFTGSPGLVPGTHFVDNGGGVSTVDLTSLGIDSQTDGVLLVTHGGNEDNYALSQVNSDGTWTVYIKDNGTDSSAHEQDPLAFVFVPKTNTTVISGRFRGDGESPDVQRRNAPLQRHQSERRHLAADHSWPIPRQRRADPLGGRRSQPEPGQHCKLPARRRWLAHRVPGSACESPWPPNSHHPAHGLFRVHPRRGDRHVDFTAGQHPEPGRQRHFDRRCFQCRAR